MHTTTVRARLIIALLMICGSFSVALVAESATAAGTYKVKFFVSDATPAVGQRVGLNGKVTPDAPGKKVKVQARAAGTGWVTIARPHLSKNSTYHSSVRFPRPGPVDLRVVKPASDNTDRGVSPVRHLRVHPSQSSPVISTSSLPTGVVDRAYSAKIKIADNRAGKFAIVGDLPAGLSLNADTGVISGTPTKVGTTDFTVRFRDTAGRTASKALSIKVEATYLITSLVLPDWTVGHSHSTTLTAKVDGTWSIPVHLLPRAFSFNAATGVISGTGAEVRKTTFPVTFTATNGLTETRNLSISVLADGPPEIATESVPGITVGHAYSTSLETVANRNGTWSLESGSLPPGLSLSSGGTISGTPISLGTYNFTVAFDQTVGFEGSDEQDLSIQVDPDTAPQIANTTMPNGTVGYGYFVTLGTVGNRQGEWALTGGSLPAGLELDGPSGEISGAPTAVGSSTFTVTFTALNGMTDTATFTISVTPAP